MKVLIEISSMCEGNDDPEQIAAHTAVGNWQKSLNERKFEEGKKKQQQKKQRSNRNTDTHMRQPGLEINMPSSSFQNLAKKKKEVFPRLIRHVGTGFGNGNSQTETRTIFFFIHFVNVSSSPTCFDCLLIFMGMGLEMEILKQGMGNGVETKSVWN